MSAFKIVLERVVIFLAVKGDVEQFVDGPLYKSQNA